MYRSSSRYLASPSSSQVSPMSISGRAGWLGGVHEGRISTYSVRAQPLTAKVARRALVSRAFLSFTLCLLRSLSGLLLRFAGSGIDLAGCLRRLQVDANDLGLLSGLVSLPRHVQQRSGDDAQGGDQPGPYPSHGAALPGARYAPRRQR